MGSLTDAGLIIFSFFPINSFISYTNTMTRPDQNKTTALTILKTTLIIISKSRIIIFLLKRIITMLQLEACMTLQLNATPNMTITRGTSAVAMLLPSITITKNLKTTTIIIPTATTTFVPILKATMITIWMAT